MTENELLATIESEERNSVGADSGLLSDQRRKALQYYYGQPYGNEVEGRSQVVTSEVFDAVEGIMPSLLSIFTSSDQIVRFEPEGPEDEQVAQQATDYINYIFSRDNNGFLVLYCAVKDALLQKNCFTKVYWEEYSESKKESYQGLTDNEFAFIAQDPELELTAHTAMPGVEGLLHDAEFRRNSKGGKICMIPVPPEEVLVSRETGNDLKTARFIEHRCKKSISQIREMGYDVPDDLSDSETGEFNAERLERLRYDDADVGGSDSEAGPSRQVWLCEAYIYADYDDDGITELRKVTKVGKTVLDNMEVDSIPFVTGTPIIMPHKLYGLSIADITMPIQEVKSAVTRSLLDNFYFINNQRIEVLDGMVNMDDVLTNRPGGVIRSKVLGGVKPLPPSALGSPAYQMLEYWDTVKENRVGVTRYNQGIDADSLNKTKGGMEMIRSASMQRIELIARIFAETYLKDLTWKILELVSKHQDKPRMVKLRNKWIPIDPREWENKFNMTVTVGLGTGSQDQISRNAMGIVGMQMQFLQAGLGDRLVTEKNIFNAAEQFAQVAFPKKDGQFFTDPDMAPPKQPQPNPDMLKLQLAAKKADMGDKQKRDKMAMDYDLALKNLAQEQNLTVTELMAEMGYQQKEQQHDMVIKGAEMSHEHTQGEVQRNHERRSEKIQQMEQDRQTEKQENQQVLQALVDGFMKTQEIVSQTAEQVQSVAQSVETLQSQIQEVAQRQHEDSESVKSVINKEVTKLERIKGKDGRLAGVRKHHADGSVSQVSVQ